LKIETCVSRPRLRNGNEINWKSA